MGLILTKSITDFSLGMTNEPREEDTRYAQLIKNFDAHTYRKKLVPFRSSEDGDDAGGTSLKKNFAIALRTGTTYSLYALGVVSGTTKAEILYKDLTTGAANDLDDSAWAAPSANQSANTFSWFELFVYYRKTGLIYGGRGTSATAGTAFWAFSPTGTAFAESSLTVTFTSLGQGLVHSKDDILYVPYYNNAGAAGAKSFIAKNDNGSWTTQALTLPDHLIPVSVCEYGNYLAIGCKPASGIGESIVYLWNRDETTTVLSQSIPWGEGNLTILEQVEGFLIGVSYVGTNATTLEQKVVFKYYAGSKPITFKELVNETTFDDSPNDIPLAKQRVNNYRYVAMKITRNGVIKHGIWKIGRTKSGTFSVVMDRTWDNDTTPVAADEIFNFILVGDYMFIAYADGGTHAVSKTNDSNLHAATSVYETVILNDGDTSLTKQLRSVTILHEALPANGSVVVKYKKDEETSFTTILTNTTDNSLRKTAINIESSGAALPTYKEITFRVESTAAVGGTTGDIGIITGLKYRSEILLDDVTD